ncbi:MBG domain-containing protein [Rhodopirellula europaea]|uniref:MBG domain-containing protein n=1 Tax=Rhodopirellula europaea TaxID=1263866 RepID=UPI001F383B61|nr:MBG domain-containing protein [Rhodopirellula europaea]
MNYQTTDSVLTGGGTVLLDPKNGVIVDSTPSGLSLIEFSLAGSDLVDAFDQLGSSVDFNNSGSLLAVGATGDAGSNTVKELAGAVYLFELDTDALSVPPTLQQVIRDGANVGGGNVLSLDERDVFGGGVALDGDGAVLAVGAPLKDAVGADPSTLTENSGAVFLFELDANDPSAPATLAQVLQDDSLLAGGGILDLVETDNPNMPNEILFDDPDDIRRLGGDSFGASIDLNDAGDRLVVGAPSFREPLVYLFEITPSDLSQPANLAQIVSDPDPIGIFESSSGFGSGVSFNGIGNRLAVGASGAGDAEFDGVVYLFDLSSNSLVSPAMLAQTIQHGTVLADGSTLEVPGDFGNRFGTGVDFDQSGSMLAIGDSTTFSPTVYLLELDGSDLASAPSLMQVLEDGTVLADGNTLQFSTNAFGTDVALSGNGAWLAVGAPQYDGPQGDRDSSGGVFLFDLVEDSNAPTLANLISVDGSQKTLGFMEAFGFSIATNSEGSRLAVGNVGDFSQEVYLFEVGDVGAAPMLSQVIEDGVVIATPVRDETIAFDDEDSFGSSLAFNDAGNLLAVGASGDDGSFNADNNSGAIYLFELDSTDLSEKPNLPLVLRNQTSLTGGVQLMLGGDSGFGDSVALTGDGMRLAAGAGLVEKVFLFEFGVADFAGVPTLANTIQQGSPLAEGGTLNLGSSVFRLGNSIAVNSTGDRLAVGEVNGDGGAVRLFELNPNDWSQAPGQSQQLRDGSALAGGGTLMLDDFTRFGAAIALDDSGNRLAIGQTDFSIPNKVFLFELDSADLSSPADLRQTIENGTTLASGVSLEVDTETFGSSLALTGPGDHLYVGDSEKRRFNVFSFSEGFGGPIELTQTIGTDSPLSNEDFAFGAGDGFGQAIALSGDGSRIAVGAKQRVHLFDVAPNLNAAPVLTNVLGSGSALGNGELLDLPLSSFGDSVSWNSAGDLLAVGDPELEFGDGGVFLFGIDPNETSEIPTLENLLTRPTFGLGDFVGIEGLDFEPQDLFGQSVALNGTGNVLVVGAEEKVHLISLDLGNLNANPVLIQTIGEGTTLSGGGTLALERVDPGNFFDDPVSAFGSAVAISRDSTRLAVGDSTVGEFGTRQGTVFVFGLNTSDLSAAPNLAHTLNDGATLAGAESLSLFDSDRFGKSVAFNADGSQLAVGAPSLVGNFDVVSTGGRVFLFDLDPANINASLTINSIIEDGTAISGGSIGMQPDDAFGSSVSFADNGNLLAIGSPGASFGADAKPGVGKVSLIGFGGSSNSGLTGDLLFGDDPSETSFIDPDDIAAILNAGNDLTLQFSNDLTVKSSLIASGDDVGDLNLTTGRSVLIEPGVTIDTSGGGLNIFYNDDSAIPSQRDPGPAFFLVDGATIDTGSGTFFQIRGFFNEPNSGGRDQPVETIITNGSRIIADAVFLGGVGDGTGVIIDKGSRIESNTTISLSGFGGDRSGGNSIGVLIEGQGTEVIAGDRISVFAVGGANGSGNHGLVVRGGARVEGAFVDTFVTAGDGASTAVIVDEAIIQATSRMQLIGLEGRNSTGNGIDVVNGSTISVLGDGTVFLLGSGGGGDAIRISDSTVSGFNTNLVASANFFNATQTDQTLRLEGDTTITSDPAGKLQVFLPRQENLVLSGSPTINGVAGSDLFDQSGVQKNSLGIGDKVLPDFASGFPNPPYLGTPEANFSFYFSQTDLTPGLFFEALSGSSTYGEVPVDPGIGLVSGQLEDGDTLGSIGLTTNFNLTQFSDAGDYTLSIDATNLDDKYRFVGATDGTFTILPADLVVTGGTYTKTYGDTFVFPDNDFTVEGLVNGESIGPVEWLSLGTRPTADVMDEPYAVGLNVSGQGSFSPLNYNISFTNGGLTVLPADLVVNPLSQEKIYGDSMLDRTRFEAIGLKNGETIQQVSFISPGIVPTANVGSYVLAASAVEAGASGFDVNNYNIEFGLLPGGLMVTPAPLLISTDDQLKLIGTEFVFNGTEFTVTGLKNSDTVSQVELASGGVTEDAELGQYVITATNPSGNLDLGNYKLTINNGVLTVRDEIPLPEVVIQTDNLVYDQFGRYIDFANTVNVLTPTNVGTINVRPTSTSESEEEPSGDEVREEDGIVYLPEMRFSSRD